MAVTAYKIKKALMGKNLTFVNVEKELNNLGYIVVLFNTPKGDEEIARYKLEYKKQTLKAFTYTKTVHIVFIDGSLHADDRLYLALHELGHIVLGHVGDGKLVTRNSVLIDIEADNFAYSIIKGNQKTTYTYVASAIIIIALMFTMHQNNAKTPTFVYESPQLSDTETISASAQPETVPLTETELETVSNIVYVTPSGTKFHKQDCRYIKNKKVTEYSRDEALHKYAPCSVCEP